MISDWQVGSPFEDRGRILEVEPERLLVSTHWSPLSGVPDLPENYHRVTYRLSEKEGKTEVTILQDNNASEEEKVHSEANWKAVLDGDEETTGRLISAQTRKIRKASFLKPVYSAGGL